jgi:beta-phosphoglucomutase-like phosphatase (HAD superfamily)
VEDSVAGVQSALAAGIVALAVSHSYDRETLVRAGAHAVLDAVAELTEESLARALTAPRADRRA